MCLLGLENRCAFSLSAEPAAGWGEQGLCFLSQSARMSQHLAPARSPGPLCIHRASCHCTTQSREESGRQNHSALWPQASVAGAQSAASGNRWRWDSNLAHKGGLLSFTPFQPRCFRSLRTAAAAHAPRTPKGAPLWQQRPLADKPGRADRLQRGKQRGLVRPCTPAPGEPRPQHNRSGAAHTRAPDAAAGIRAGRANRGRCLPAPEEEQKGRWGNKAIPGVPREDPHS